MASINTYIEPLKTDLTALARMEPEQLKDFLKGRFNHLSKKENEALLGAIKKEIEETKAGLKEARKDLRGMEREGSQSLYGSRPESSGEKQEIDGLMDALRLLDSETRLASTSGARDFALHNVDMKDGKDINISPIELDGETLTYNLGGGALPQTESLDGTLDLGLNADGSVSKDVNSDGVLNFADYEASQKAAYDPLKGQKVFVNTTGQRWELASANTQGGEYTFKVTKDGKHSFVKFTNAKNVSFFFDNMDLPDRESLERWPTEILQRAFRGTNPASLHDQMFKAETTLDKRLSYIPGYKNAVDEAGFNQAVAQFGIQNVSFEDYQQAVNTLYGGVDDPSKDRQAITAEILSQGGKELVHALVLGVALNSGEKAKENLVKLFGPATAAIEGALGDPLQYTENDKIVAMLLETQADAAGNFGGREFFTVALASGSGKPYIPGLMTDKKNPEGIKQSISAIKKYEQLVTQIGLTPTGSEQATTEKLTGMLPKAPTDARKDFMARVEQMKTHSQGIRSVDLDVWEGFVDLLSANLFKADGTVRDDAWKVILDAMDGKGATPVTNSVGMGSLGTVAGSVAGTGIGVGVAVATGAEIGSVLPGVGTLIGAGVGLAIGFFGSLFSGAEKDELLANMIVVMDAVLPFDFKKQLFPKIAKDAQKWLVEDSDDLWESDADNQGIAIDTLNKYLGDLDAIGEAEEEDIHAPENQAASQPQEQAAPAN